MRSLLPIVLVLAAPACGPRPAPDELTVFAAASLRDALTEVGRDYERETGTPVRFQFGSSGDLASQLRAAPRADLFVSADPELLERLERDGQVVSGSSQALLGNRLVVIEPVGAPPLAQPFRPEALRDAHLDLLALADPRSAPAGRYAQEWLQGRGLWEALAGHVLAAPNARAALAAVESGAARAGIVYRTDALSSELVRVVWLVPTAEHRPIVYPVARLREARHPRAADLQAFLTSEAATAVFRRHGFETPQRSPGPSPEPSPEPGRPPRVPASGAAPTLEVLAITLRVAAGATLLVALPAIALGYLLARRVFFGRSLVETLVALPLVLPPTAVGYLLLALLARDGPLGPARLGFDPGLLFTRRGAILASALMALPLAARTARLAFEAVDPRLVLMGRSLGLSSARCFATITLPLAGRGLLAALLLAFGRALGEFGATVIVAGNVPGRTQTLALAIFSDIQVGDREHALGLVGICVVVAFVTIFVVERLLARPARPVRASPDRERRA